jgi:hypothetical protein
MTLFQTIEHWKATDEWETIRKWYPQTDTHERYFNIVLYIRQNRSKYGHRYRDKLLGEPDSINRFGYFTVADLDNALKCMNQQR